MKKVLFSILCLSMGAVAVKAQSKGQAPTPPPLPASMPQRPMPPPVPAPAPVDPNAGKFKFKEEIHNFGEIPEGPIAEYDFEFTNTGKKPIIISNAKGSCGCTVPTWPHDAIMPNQVGKIHVAFTSSGRPGMIDKAVTIESNAAQQPMMLYIKGTVKPKPVEAKPAIAPTPASNK